MRARGLLGLLLAGLLASPVVAQTVTPQPATTLDTLTIVHLLGGDGCNFAVVSSEVTIEAEDVSIEVVALPVPNPICGVPPPLALFETIGPLPAGDYTLEITGTIGDVPFAPATASFVVEPGPYGDLVSPIPTLAPWGLIALALLVGVVAVVRLRASG